MPAQSKPMRRRGCYKKSFESYQVGGGSGREGGTRRRATDCHKLRGERLRVKAVGCRHSPTKITHSIEDARALERPAPRVETMTMTASGRAWREARGQGQPAAGTDRSARSARARGALKCNQFGCWPAGSLARLTAMAAWCAYRVPNSSPRS